VSLRRILLGAAAAIGAFLVVRRLVRVREDTDWEHARRPGRIVDVDGVGMHYVEEGSGPTVLLIHGFGGHTYSFRHTIPSLSADHQAVALDLQGFGYSERPEEGDYSLTEQARLVTRFMERLGIERAVVIGHSMGGGVAMRVATTWPDRVEKLVLVASVPGEGFPTVSGRTLPLAKLILPLLTRLAASRLLSATVLDPSSVTAETREAYLAPLRIRGSMDGLYQMLRDNSRLGPVDHERIRQPTLILGGAGDRVISHRALERLRERLPHAVLVTVEGAGHLLLEERPDECNAAIRRFIDGDGEPDPS
jgi:pimeloyl-ACP methyl ester carboxylesterase